MKKNFLFIALQIGALSYKAQTIYSNSFNSLPLQTYTTSSSSTLYTGVPAGFSLINDGLTNNPGSAANPNRPFHISGFETTGWAVAYNTVENDTFLVSTSWLDTTGLAVSRWVITPPVSNIGANTVLTWLAKSPDPNYAEGYEVYGTNKPGTLVPQDFTAGDRLFALPDAGTSGGGEKSQWNRRSVSLGAFAGQTLRFAFRNISKDMYQLWIDDIQVVTLPNSLDAALAPDATKRYILANTVDSVRVSVSNLGAAVINTITLNYQVGNSSVNTEYFTFSGGLAYGQNSPIKFALPYSVSQPGFYTVKSWIGNVNNGGDQVTANDTTRYSLTVQASSPAKTVLFEQFVSANNGEGPDAQERALALQSGQVVVVNIHDQDSMKETNSTALLADYKRKYATAMADRTYFNDAGAVAAERTYYNNHVSSRLSAITPVSISIGNKNFNTATNQLSFSLNAAFVGEVKGDYRINAYLVENQVGGPVSDTTINGYNQLNNSYNVPWSPYYQKGYYSPAAGTYILNLGQYRHQNVLVHAFDGAYGSAGTIPANGGTQGQSYQQQFTLTVPASGGGINKFNPDNLYIVGFVTEYSADKNNRRVLNAVKEKLNSNPEIVGINEASLRQGLSVYPNPSSGVFYFNYEGIGNRYVIQVYDMLGHCVRIVDVANSPAMQPLDLSMLSNGVYVLKIEAGRTRFTEKVVIQKGQN